MSIRLGDIAPDFEAETNKGPLRFHEYTNNSWSILFSHPDDFTPVCTTELSAVALSSADFASRGVKLIGLSANDVESHHKWIKDIDTFSNGAGNVDFPIIADKSRKISELYGMLDHQDATNVDNKGLPLTVRSVFIIDPKHVVRLILTYPASTGRNFPEILRVIDSLQLGDKHKIATPANWNINGKKGDDVIVRNDVKTDEAQKLYGEENVKVVFPYLRYVADPSTK